MSLSYEESALVSVRIVTLEWYLASPIPGVDATFARNHVIKKVPILRIFGPTAAGQKACVHVHGVFPYFFVPVPDKAVDGLDFKLALGLDRALNLAKGEKNEDVPQVHKVQEVSGTPFYGFHPKEHRFLKVFLYDPAAVRRAADLLQSGAVLGLRLQPHESHVPYTLQFMMDYNLQGMNSIHLSGAKFRRKTDLSDEDMLQMLREGNASTPDLLDSDWLDLSVLPSHSQRHFDVNKLPERLLMPETIDAVSTSQIELDATTTDILNAGEKGRTHMNPGLRAIWNDERERRRVLNIAEPLTPESSPPRPAEASRRTDSDLFWLERFKEQVSQMKEEASETSSSIPKGADGDVTENVELPGGIDGIAYAAETSDEVSLPSATALDLCASILQDSSGRQESPSKDSDEDYIYPSPEHSATSSYHLQESTLVDEEVLSQSQSQRALSLSQDAIFKLDPDDEELVELMSELDAGAAVAAHEMSQNSSSLEEILGHTVASRQRTKEDEAETFEMTQIVWDDGDAFVGSSDHDEGDWEEKGEKEKGLARDQDNENDPVWEDHDEQFWQEVGEQDFL